uniref:Uncharacterized protein n=1 Tax=Chromera velia CCMP2878 TaxID=1169474 RepID=A0A0G4HQ71_9ALVE|eukprot:Cvel_30094.t1-p1 / transcript=Cvel_30094.t1 / gene=Cvel_30094 / organism=Chromera_velia_CCMP2878 / gene_product=hypothetical protein / transcript_product=hypothetical protein / location=Cvel_scaffold4238:4821-6689(+) / protein_length=477 / sequence_SO=supercontig / SO=protein_coding / is_pseudo=false
MGSDKAKDAPAVTPADAEAAKRSTAAFLASAKEISVKGVVDTAKEKPLWLLVTVLTFVSMAFGFVFFLWNLPSHVIALFKFVLSPRTYLVVVYWLYFVLRHVVLPVVVVVGNLWVFRQVILRLAAAWLKEKNGVLLKEPLLSFTWDWKAKTCQLDANDLKLCEGLEEKDQIVSARAITVGAAKSKTATTEVTAVDVNVILDEVDVSFVAYDPKFKDTNINRLIAKLTPKGEKPDVPPADEVPATEPEKKQEVKKEQRVRVIALIRKATIHVKAAGPLGVRQLIPSIILENERIEPSILGNKLKLVAWLNGLILRTLANSGFDAVAGAFKGAGHVVEGASDLMLSGIDKFAGFVPGGQVLTGATGGVRDVVGGTFGGVGKVADGLAGGGKALVEGFTSGSVTGVGKGVVGAGKNIGEGVVGGVTSTVGGVGKGVTSIGKGFFGAGKSLFGRKDKSGSGGNTPADGSAKGEEETDEAKK